MYTIILGMIGFALIYASHAFQTSGPAWLGFLLVICGVIIDLATEPKQENRNDISY